MSDDPLTTEEALLRLCQRQQTKIAQLEADKAALQRANEYLVRRYVTPTDPAAAQAAADAAAITEALERA